MHIEIKRRKSSTDVSQESDDNNDSSLYLQMDIIVDERELADAINVSGIVKDNPALDIAVEKEFKDATNVPSDFTKEKDKLQVKEYMNILNNELLILMEKCGKEVQNLYDQHIMKASNAAYSNTINTSSIKNEILLKTAEKSKFSIGCPQKDMVAIDIPSHSKISRRHSLHELERPVSDNRDSSFISCMSSVGERTRSLRCLREIDLYEDKPTDPIVSSIKRANSTISLFEFNHRSKVAPIVIDDPDCSRDQIEYSSPSTSDENGYGCGGDANNNATTNHKLTFRRPLKNTPYSFRKSATLKKDNTNKKHSISRRASNGFRSRTNSSNTFKLFSFRNLLDNPSGILSSRSSRTDENVLSKLRDDVDEVLRSLTARGIESETGDLQSLGFLYTLMKICGMITVSSSPNQSNIGRIFWTLYTLIFIPFMLSINALNCVIRWDVSEANYHFFLSSYNFANPWISVLRCVTLLAIYFGLKGYLQRDDLSLLMGCGNATASFDIKYFRKRLNQIAITFLILSVSYSLAVPVLYNIGVSSLITSATGSTNDDDSLSSASTYRNIIKFILFRMADWFQVIIGFLLYSVFSTVIYIHLCSLYSATTQLVAHAIGSPKLALKYFNMQCILLQMTSKSLQFLLSIIVFSSITQLGLILRDTTLYSLTSTLNNPHTIDSSIGHHTVLELDIMGNSDTYYSCLILTIILKLIVVVLAMGCVYPVYIGAMTSIYMKTLKQKGIELELQPSVSKDKYLCLLIELSNANYGSLNIYGMEINGAVAFWISTATILAVAFIIC